MAIYALGSFSAAIFNSILPETKGKEMPDTITQTENLRSKQDNRVNVTPI